MYITQLTKRIISELNYKNIIYLTQSDEDLLEIKFIKGKYLFTLNGRAVRSTKTKLTAQKYITEYLNTGFVLDLIV